MADDDRPIYEIDRDADKRDPDETPLRDRKVITQPYDIAVESLVEQVKSSTIFLRPLSSRPRFQRQYVWNDTIASRLVESILLNVPIPPCYLSQNEEFELDVIDGQQRIYSLYRFLENQFPLVGLDVLTELNGSRFFELDSKLQRQVRTFSLRCVLITNQSHPEIKFDVFERLNSNTVPLNAQELRNCIYRGPLNDLLGELSYGATWLRILGRKAPDKRLRDEELILRFLAFHILGQGTYQTPLKHWLNKAAKRGRHLPTAEVEGLSSVWDNAISNVVAWYDPVEAFRRPGSKSLNRALFDLLMTTAKKVPVDDAPAYRHALRDLVGELMQDEEFSDLIGRSVDHKRRTVRRFELWQERVEEPLLGA